MSFKKQYLKSQPVCKVTFTLTKEQANHANSVRLLGDFNEWQVTAAPMKKLKNGNFTETLRLPTDTHFQFRYLLDDNAWENDWDADDYVASPISLEENSVINT